MTRLRNYFLTGFIVCAPLAITAYIAWSFIGWVDSWVKPYIPGKYNPDTYLPFPVPGFGLIVALFLITMIGFLTANFIGRAIVSYGEYLLSRMPFVRSIYSALKQIFADGAVEQGRHVLEGRHRRISAQGRLVDRLHRQRKRQRDQRQAGQRR